MPDKRKKKAREDAIEMLKQKAANNGLKNQAQAGANFEKANKPRQSVSTSQTSNSSTTPRNTTQSTMRGSQSPSAVNSLFKETARKATGNRLTSTDKYGSGSARGDDRGVRTSTTTSLRDKAGVTLKNRRDIDRYDEQRATRLRNNKLDVKSGQTVKGAGKQWLGGQISNVGTTVQELETTANSYNKARAEKESNNYSLRSREDAERREASAMRNLGVKENIRLKDVDRVYKYDPNSFSQRAIRTGDKLIESGSKDIEKAKEGLGAVGRLGVDLGANALQMMGDRVMAFVPGVGQALAMGSLVNRAGGTASYEARQQGANPDQQFMYAQGVGLIEGLSEGIFNSVSAFRSTYGRGAFSLADRLTTRTAASNIVQKYLKSDLGKSLAVNLARLGAQGFEEGFEEVVADIAEPALKYALMGSFDGYDPKEIAYDFMVGALMGAIPGSAEAFRGVESDVAMSKAMRDGQLHAENVINRGLVQGREGQNVSDAEVLARQMQGMMDRGQQIQPAQVRMLQEAIGQSQETNARAFERRSTEETQRAVQEGRLRETTGTRAEATAYERGIGAVEQRSEEKARQVMGADASPVSVGAVGRVVSGTADIDDFETILTDSKAKEAVETITGSKLSVDNAQARSTLEDLTVMNEIANKDTVRKEVQTAHAEDIRAELTNMDKRGGDIFAKNYAEAVSVIGSGAEYEDVFTRLYADGTVKEANFEDAYNRIVLQRGGEVAQYFTEAKAKEAFNAGRMAMITQNGQTTAKNMAEKMAAKPSGLTFEGNAKSKLSNKQINALTKFAERGNVHIRVVETMSKTLDDGTVLSANGSYRDGTIYIAADASNKLVTVAKHEMTHHIKKMSPERYQELEDFVFRKWYDNDATRMEDEIRKKQLLYGDISVEEAREEIIADASEAFFTDQGAIQEVCSFSKKLGRAIHDGIKTLLDTLLDLQESDNLSGRGYGDFLDDIDILREAERMWLDALNDTVEKSREARPSADDYTDANAFDPTDYKFSLVEDKDEIRRLNAEPSQKAYRAMALIDGKLYPPMSTKVKGEDGKWKLNTGLDIGQWIESDITTDHTMFNKEGKFILKKDNGDTIYAAYNPYIHSSDTMLNDQFSTAYKRPNIVVVEGDIPTSELSNGYRAEHDLDNGTHITAKDTTGVIEWKAGIVQGKLTGTRTVYLTQHFKPVRVVPDSEVAKHIQDMVKGTDVVIPYNVVTPNLREELLKLGVDMAQSEDKKYQVDLNAKFSIKEDQDYQENEDIRYSVKEDEETTNPNVNVLDKSGKVLTTSKGDPVAKFEKNGSAQFSLKTYEDKGRSVLKNYLKKMVKAGDFSQAEADQMYNEMETIYRITRDLADTGKYAPFTAWSEADVVMGKNNKPVFSSVKANSEYKMNIDFSTICKKRRTLDAVFRTMINRGMMENLDLNKDESAALVVNINDLIRKYDFEAACALCFVEARRYRQQQTAKTFRDMWNGLVESMYKDKSKIEYFNFGEDKTIKEVPDGIHTMDNKDLDLTYVKQIATARKEDGKLMQTAEAKAAREILNHPSQRKLMRIGDMMASTGFENMQVKNPALMKIYNAKKGTGGAKSSFGDVQYLNEIINSKTFDRKKAYAVSGVRIQSFSDYVPRMVFDYVQVIADLAAKRLPAHAYTKEVLFVLQFGLTGTKINMSLVPDVVKDGIAPGLDKNGNYVWNTDGTFPWEDYKDAKGRTWPGARSIQKAKGYKENCGTIAVGISDEQIWKMLADPEIQMVIPYHKSSLNPLVAQMTNVDRFTDYTDYQNTKTRDGKNVPKEFDWDNKLFELSHGKDGKLLPKSEWGDIQGLVQEYVDWCNENDYVPKFERFLYMKDGSINPGYYKMLEDFALLDEEGNFKPQDDVKMRFPTKDSAYGDMASLIEQGLSEDTTLERKRDSKVGDIVDEIGELLKTEEGRQALTQKSLESDILSARMDNEDEDVRYQLKDLDSTDTIASQNTIAKLEQNVKDLKAEFKRTDLKTADQKQVRIQAGKLIKRHDSNMGVQKDLTDTFNKIFRLYKEKGTEAFDEVYKIAKDAAVNVVNNISEVRSEGREEYDAIKQYLRETPITISEDMKKNITDYNEFRKRNFGKLKLKNGETSNIDNVYMELMEMFPEQFTDDYVNPHDQLNHIVDVLDNFAPYYETLDGASEEMQDYVVEIAADIMETAYNLQTKKTFADKKYLEKEAAVKKAREKALESRNKALERQKTRYEKQIGELKQKNQDFKEQTRENAEKKRRIKQIANIYKRLNEKLQSATDTKHLPDGYAPIVSDILARFDFTTEGMEKWAARTGKTSRKMYTMNNLQSQLRALAEKEGGELEIDAELIPIVEELTDTLGDNEVRISDLNSEDLTKIKQLFAAFEHQINSYNKMFVEGQKQTTAEAAHKAFDDMKEDNKWKLGIMGRMFNDKSATSNFTPSDFFTLIGGEIGELYQNARRGFDKYVEHTDDAMKFLQDAVNNKDADKWANHKGTYTTSSGEEIILTDAQLMDLYVSSKREQAQGHIYFGGIVSAPVKVKKGVTAKELEEKRVIPTQDDLVSWFSQLSPEQIKVAESLQKYLTDVPSEWGNETSMAMYGYKKFNEEIYWPIQSSNDYMESNFDMKGTDPTLKNVGPSRAVTIGANNAIMIDDIFTVFCKHIAQMAAYNAYVPAISDFQRVWNYTEGNDADRVKARFKRAYSKDAYNYVENFFKSLNGVYKDNFGGDLGILNFMTSTFKKAAVGGNIRVLVQQPTAIARAALIVNPAYLTASIPKTAVENKKAFQEMMDHCPIAKWKVWGFNSTDVSSASRNLRDIMIGKNSLSDKVFMDMYGVADNVTWTVIFNACKMQVEAQNKSLTKGSDEYWEKVNDLASRVFDRTQVVDSPFHRSNLMKSKDTGVKMMTAFMAEPTKTINMLNTEMTLAMREMKAGNHVKAAGIAARVGMVMTANAALLAVAQALVDAMRHTGGDDDKDKGKYKDRWLAYWKDNFKENMAIIGMIPILKDVKSLWDGYDVARMDMQGVQRVVQSIQYLKKYIENPEESKYTGFEEYSNVALAVAYTLGLPISNVKRDIEAVALTGAEATNNPDVALWFMKNKYQVNKKTKSLWINSYFNALENGNEGLADNIKKYITSNGVVTDKDIEKAANKRRKENPTEEDQARMEQSQKTLEGSNIWKTSSDKDKERYSGYLEKIALEIEDTNTNSITKYATDGLTNEQVVLFKLALRKADAQNDNSGGFNNDEKKAALKMLERNYKFTEKQKKVLMSIKS